MSALSDEIETAIRKVLRQELASALAHLADGGRLLRIKEAAARLGLAVSSVYHGVADGSIPHLKRGGRLFFRLGDLDAYTERLGRTRQIQPGVKQKTEDDPGGP